MIAHKVCVGRRGERGTHFPLDGRGLQPTKFGWEEEEESAASAGCRLEKKINWEAAAEGGGRCFLIQTLARPSLDPDPLKMRGRLAFPKTLHPRLPILPLIP